MRLNVWGYSLIFWNSRTFPGIYPPAFSRVSTPIWRKNGVQKELAVLLWQQALYLFRQCASWVDGFFIHPDFIITRQQHSHAPLFSFLNTEVFVQIRLANPICVSHPDGSHNAPSVLMTVNSLILVIMSFLT